MRVEGRREKKFELGRAWIDECPGGNLSRSCGVGPDPLTLQSRSPAPILMVVFHGEGYFRWAWVEMDWYTDTWLGSTASLPPLMIPGFVIACS